jgi:hypothetical protein
MQTRTTPQDGTQAQGATHMNKDELQFLLATLVTQLPDPRRLDWRDDEQVARYDASCATLRKEIADVVQKLKETP